MTEDINDPYESTTRWLQELAQRQTAGQQKSALAIKAAVGKRLWSAKTRSNACSHQEVLVMEPTQHRSCAHCELRAQAMPGFLVGRQRHHRRRIGNTRTQGGVWARTIVMRYPFFAKIGRLSVYEQEIPDSEKFTALRKLAVLERVNDAEIWELAHAGRWARIPPRNTIMREGESGKSLFFLASGQAKVTKQGRLLSVLSAGECFGEMAYVKGGGIARQATVESITDMVLAEFDPDALEKTSTNCQLQLSNALLHSLVDRLALADERIART